jgi:hypothetical protein
MAARSRARSVVATKRRATRKTIVGARPLAIGGTPAADLARGGRLARERGRTDVAYGFSFRFLNGSVTSDVPHRLLALGDEVIE